MANLIKVDICAIGGGSGGMAVAGRAARMGASAVLIERKKMGGDCLNYGCVPSKSLLAAGRIAALGRRSEQFGIKINGAEVDGQGVHRHVREVMDTIAPNDSPERFERMGVKVIHAQARFTGPSEIEAGDYRIRARHFVIATGSKSAVPPIPGIDEVPYFTNETIFEKDFVPKHLIIVGGGPTGIEMAQAHRNLGAKVTLIEAASILPRDDPELVAVIRQCLVKDGIEILERTEVTRMRAAVDRISVEVKRGGNMTLIDGTHILVAAGRWATVDGLDLDRAGVVFTDKAIVVDRRLRTSNKRIFAVGDVAGGYQFAHTAGYHAWIVLRNALLKWPSKVDHSSIPWVTYTHPELAHVGLTEAEASRRHGRLRILRWKFADNDRAHTERDTDGLIKVVAKSNGQVIGTSIVGPHAGELLYPWALLVARRMNVRAIAHMIAPYPTYGYASKYAADSFFEPLIYGSGMKRLVRILGRIC
ncbi:MAG TPA: FAD-dependent oxidoreductase [Hyphomicrobiales bacterium]|nr:FAD-dependent oxidoreductase [Hyphomicrobiales bacterium]